MLVASGREEADTAEREEEPDDSAAEIRLTLLLLGRLHVAGVEVLTTNHVFITKWVGSPPFDEPKMVEPQPLYPKGKAG